MTALDQYERLECTGLWRDSTGGQRLEVVVALRDATLVMTDKAGRPLAHWSLPALIRKNQGTMPALYAPGPDSHEDLELDDPIMVEGVERVCQAIDRRRAHPGRLRRGIALSILFKLVVVAVVWLPGAMMRYTASVVPDAKRAEIGASVLAHIFRVTGEECRGSAAETGLAALRSRLKLPGGGRIVVLSGGNRATAHLPGGLFLVNRTLVEDYDTPDVLAGYLLAERVRAAGTDPLIPMMSQTGSLAALRLLTTGDLPGRALESFAEHLLTSQSTAVSDRALLVAFAGAEVSAAPYAYASDVTGVATQALIQGDPMAGKVPPPLLSDSAWVSLQGVCGG